MKCVRTGWCLAVAGVCVMLLSAACATKREARPRDEHAPPAHGQERAPLPAPAREPTGPSPAPPPTQPPAITPSPTPSPTSGPAAPGGAVDVWIETSPGVRVNRARGEIEFDGVVPIDCHNPRTPHVYIEIIACTPDSKEHEALVLTRITPSHLHAALVLLGLEPGTPGTWTWEGEHLRETPPTGPRVGVRLEWTANGVARTADPREWIVDVRTSRRLIEVDHAEFWRFAGSRFETRAGSEVYVADREGLLVGFACFSGETIAYSRMEHHDSNVQSPVWIADRTIVPVYDTPVRVRLSVHR